ncbi:MAG: hypothetical protein ACLQM6_08430 [Acidobacteriaceae bacterium]
MAASTASSSPKTSNASCCANDPLKYAGTIMRIKLILPVALLFLICSIHSPAQDSIPGPSQQKKEQTPSIRKISTVTVACLVDKLTSIGGAPPEYVAGKYKVQALYGKYLEQEQTNGIHILVYGPHGASATLYESYLEKAGAKPSIFIGEWATFKDEQGRLAPDDLPGGLATHEWYIHLMKTLQKKTAFVITSDEAKASKRNCIWTP